MLKAEYLNIYEMKHLERHTTEYVHVISLFVSLQNHNVFNLFTVSVEKIAEVLIL